MLQYDLMCAGKIPMKLGMISHVLSLSSNQDKFEHLLKA